jgi:hypothetical protein
MEQLFMSTTYCIAKHATDIAMLNLGLLDRIGVKTNFFFEILLNTMLWYVRQNKWKYNGRKK